MRLAPALIAALFVTPVCAKLPPPTDGDKAKAAETAAKTAWSDKIAQHKLCLAMGRTAEAYRNSTKAAGKPVPAPLPTPPCVDPGHYVSLPDKPLEASGAHSPPATAASPPSTNATAAEIASGVKKK